MVPLWKKRGGRGGDSLLWKLFQIKDLIAGDAMLCAINWNFAGERPCCYQNVLGLHAIAGIKSEGLIAL